MDVNASGTLTLADKGQVNANLTHMLPPPVETAPSVISTSAVHPMRPTSARAPT